MKLKHIQIRFGDWRKLATFCARTYRSKTSMKVKKIRGVIDWIVAANGMISICSPLQSSSVIKRIFPSYYSFGEWKCPNRSNWYWLLEWDRKGKKKERSLKNVTWLSFDSTFKESEIGDKIKYLSIFEWKVKESGCWEECFHRVKKV